MEPFRRGAKSVQSTVDAFVRAMNVARFRELLTSETDERRLRTIRHLLKEETADGNRP